MKAASISEIKKELQASANPRLVELCLRLAKFKMENKELLTYLLFEEDDTVGYIQNVKTEIDLLFDGINKSHVYFVKKTLRKILRTINKYSRYSALASVEAELLIHFCRQMQSLGISIERNTVLKNIYQNQLMRINKVLASLHEDLQYDYRKEMAGL
jgi:hypothetical protein